MLASKRIVLGYQRKQDRILSRLEEKAAKLMSLQESADEHFQRHEEDFQSLFQQSEALRRQVQDEAHQQQTLASQTAQIRGSVSSLELDRDRQAKDNSTAKKKWDDIIQSINEYEFKHIQELKELDTKKTSKTTALKAALAELKQIAGNRDSIEKNLKTTQKRHEEILLEHGLRSPPQNTVVRLDMPYFREKLEKERQATGDEEMAKFSLIAQLAQHRSEIFCLGDQTSKAELSKSNSLRTEQEQRKVLSVLAENESRQKQQLVKTKAKLEKLRAEYQLKLTERQNKKCQIEEKSLLARQEESQLEHKIQFVRSRFAVKKEKLQALCDVRKVATKEATKISEVEQNDIRRLTQELEILSKELAACSSELPLDDKYSKRILSIVTGT